MVLEVSRQEQTNRQLLERKTLQPTPPTRHHPTPPWGTGESDALFLTKSGKKWKHRTFGQQMSDAGKQVWDKFVPYCARHWVAVQFLIANDYNVYATAKRLGDTVAVVERSYLPHAEARANLDRRFAMPRFRRGSE